MIIAITKAAIKKITAPIAENLPSLAQKEKYITKANPAEMKIKAKVIKTNQDIAGI